MDKEISQKLQEIIANLGLEVNPLVSWASPTQEHLCDLTTTVALAIWKQVQVSGKSEELVLRGPMDLANYLVKELEEVNLGDNIEQISVAAPGHINIRLKNSFWEKLLASENNLLEVEKADGRKVMVEYGHPNTHKEMHVGHLRTLITGESLARLGEKRGATVMRANYQGDIGPHVAKALYGVRVLLAEANLQIEEVESRTLAEKAKFLGEAYVRGNQDYEQEKEQIDAINQQLYAQDKQIEDLYQRTRQWSLDYFGEIYARMDTRYDKYYFETQVAAAGKKIVEDNVGKVFENDDGTLVFRGENYGLHTRVFVTKQGTPTYEAKEMALGLRQYEDFPFDLNLHIVANEQADYFKVVFKALEQLDEKVAAGEKHISMGMVNLVGMKISSRTGVVVTVNQLVEKVKDAVAKLVANGKSEVEDEAIEALTIGALKFAMLKQSTTMNTAFDIQQSVALIGFTGPYLQYTHARCKSVLRKAGVEVGGLSVKTDNLEKEEKDLLFWLNQYPRAVERSWEQFSPHHLCEYLHELAARYNVLYNNLPILEADAGKKNLRLKLSAKVGETLKEALYLLGIKAPEKL